MGKCLQCGFESFTPAATCPQCGAASPRIASGNPAALSGDLLRLIAEGKKLEAIKMYHDRTGARLIDAKNAVEALQRGDPLPGAASADGPADLNAELRMLIQQGRKLQAVKLYKDRTGVSLMDAKKAIETLEAGATGNGVVIEDALRQELLPLLRMGEMREATRLYQRRTGARAQEAKRALAALARQHGVYDRQSAWLRTSVLLAIAGAVLFLTGGIAFLLSR
jgi:ribosomal protein L7/L12